MLDEYKCEIYYRTLEPLAANVLAVVPRKRVFRCGSEDVDSRSDSWSASGGAFQVVYVRRAIRDASVRGAHDTHVKRLVSSVIGRR